jgi:NAD-dependent deacetylase
MRTDLPSALLADADTVLVLTGAGISAESGVPTFRGPDGLWQSFRPEQLATPEAFARDPLLVWEWYGWRRERLAACRPNSGHLALAHWMLGRSGVTLVTQNVDGLHEAAAREAAGPLGNPGPALPLRLHGSLFRVRCTACPHRAEWRGPIDTLGREALPRCPDCHALLRPDVVWFGEALPEAELAQAYAAAASAEACLVVGTQGAVYPAAGLAFAAQRAGAHLIVVDPDPTAFDSLADVRIVARAGEVLPEMLRQR